MMHIPGSFQLMKSLNRTLILNTIRTKGVIPRSEIAKLTKLTPPTVTNIVNELIREDLVVETEPGTSSGGRKPILLSINGKARFIIGVDIGVSGKIRFGVSDLNGQIVKREVKHLPNGSTSEKEFVKLLVTSLRALIGSLGSDKEKLIGVGIAMHGMVDSEQGIALWAPSLKFKDLPLKEELERALNLPIRVENDAKALAIGEVWFGNGQGEESLVCINVGEGVGAGVILDGKLLHGNDHIAGEVGHTIIDLSGPKCSCGNYGCLQAFASGQALKERALKELALGRSSVLQEKCKGDFDLVDGRLIYEAALEGDSLSIDVLHQTGRYLAVGILNILHFYNPGRIIIGGGVSKAERFILEPIHELVKKRALTPRSKNTRITVSELGEEGSLVGAITLVLSELFTQSISR
ncbi:ROK family transcriptional regulator [Evansella cellulosilytica]|uniref:ROK family protein n=1 Tax=Evansella cellulosilytica (strain ATCC 21833 / DSM 2522 / FERM P-1141 / JCM 9156 / N-4) TaxID=649639 RepID=E6TQE1_EVAC2|nr:ROK family transcriptional regulator [Evansella cellulosilytica]ADU29319.1 ROK family protein [Evansella cellulosilytica DSM 2522]